LVDEVPLRWRAASRAYDVVVMGLGIWFLVDRGGWLPWACFVFANLAGLLLFDNRLSSRPVPLTRPWFAPFTFVGVGALTLWPFLLILEDDAIPRAIIGLVIFFLTRSVYPLTPSHRRRKGVD
jgi:FtsH-binding integral membrane protein